MKKRKHRASRLQVAFKAKHHHLLNLRPQWLPPVFFVVVIIILMTSLGLSSPKAEEIITAPATKASSIDTNAQRHPITYDQLSVFDYHGSVVMLVDPEGGNIRYVNQAAVNFYGYPKEMLLSMNMAQINTLDSDQLQLEMDKALYEHRNYFDFKHRTATGETKNVEVYSYPVAMTSGERLLFSIIHDVTEKHQAALQLRRSIILVVTGFCALALGATIFANVFYRQKKVIANQHQQMHALFDNMKESFALFEVGPGPNGPEYHVREANASFSQIFGLQEKDVVGLEAKALLPDFEVLWSPAFGHLLAGGETKVIPELELTPGRFYHTTLYMPLENTIAMMAMDTTTLMQVHRSMERERHYYHKLLQTLGQGVVSLNHLDEIVLMNTLAATILEVDATWAIGKHYKELFSFERGKEPVFLEPLKDQPHQVHYDIELRGADGRLLPMELNISPILDQDNRWTGTVFTFSDYSDMRIKEEEIRYLSYHDQLTGLFNRHYFEEAINRLEQGRYLPLSLVMIDVNGLKMTNDAFGHAMGDLLLKSVANHLKAVCRADDIVARVGGDEFVLLLPKTDHHQLTRITSALKLGPRGVEAIQVDTEEGVRMLLLSYAVGTITKHDSYEDIHHLIRVAENNMYQNKMEEHYAVRKQMIETILEQLFSVQENEKDHAARVSRLLEHWGKKIALEQQLIDELALLGLVHDIGKITLTKNLLQKPGHLDAEDWTHVKRHCECGYHILRSVEGYGAIAEAVLDHHERWDGKGYPRGQLESGGHWMGRMLSIADAYEAMTANRSYKEKRTPLEALKEIQRCSGSQFDPEMVARFLESFTLDELGAM